MKVSFNWLRDYVDIPVDVDDLVKHFTMKGLTVEDAHPVPLEVSNVVSARVLSTSAHPQRQDLKVGEVTDGTRVYSVVSGAPGFEEDKVVVLALPGSTLPGGIVVGTREVDGVISEGMVVCSNEILTGNAHREGEDIIILPDTTVLGKPVQDVLGLDDYLLDLELTVNYSHCLSVLGVAIECAAMFNIPLKLPPTLTQWDWAGPKGSVPPSGYLEAQGDEEFTIELPDPDLCPRYVGKSVLGIKPHYSHVQIERRLMVAGMRPINAIVDATNYVMLETGQPLHAFDRDLISGKVVYARRSRRGEKLRTLDGEQREIQEGTLVIADSSGPIAIAGVMGGANTEVTSKTKNILLETAYFSPRSVRETSQRLRLRTEAAIRFEKGLDPTMQVAVAEHAAHLITQLAGGVVVKGIAQKNLIDGKPRRVTLHTRNVERYLGTPISIQQQEEILSSLRFGMVEKDLKNGTLTVDVPPRRVDVEEEVDLIEEVARYEGYDKFGDKPMSKAVAGGPPSKRFVVRDRIKDFLVELGGNEVVSSSIISQEDVEILGWKDDEPRGNLIPLMKPLTSSETSLRSSLLPGLMKIIRYNQKQNAPGMFIWETGTVFFDSREELPLEFQQLALASYGILKHKTWFEDELSASFYHTKGVIATLLDLLGIEDVKYLPEGGMPFHPGRSAKVVVNGNAIGEFGELHPKVLRNAQLQGPVTMAWLSLDVLLEMASESQYREVARLMPLERDLAVIVPEDVPAGEVQQVVAQAADSVDEIVLFDVYTQPPIPQGMKSLAMRLRYQPRDRTLTEEDLTQDRKRILRVLEEKFGARQRV